LPRSPVLTVTIYEPPGALQPQHGHRRSEGRDRRACPARPKPERP
jgi:hypothetical protein